MVLYTSVQRFLSVIQASFMYERNTLTFLVFELENIKIEPPLKCTKNKTTDERREARSRFTHEFE